MKPRTLSDIVEITCYGDTEKMERGRAIKFYMTCMAGSEGAEHERYETIVFQLLNGAKKASDQVDFFGRY